VLDIFIIDKKTDPNWFKFEEEEYYDYSSSAIQGEVKFHLSGIIPENGIYKSENALVFHDGLTLNSDLKILADLSWLGKDYNNFRTDLIDSLFNRQVTNVRSRKGVCLNLCSPWASYNYAHYLLDVLTKFEMVEKACPIPMRDFDFFLLPHSASIDVLSIIKPLNIPHDKIIWNKYSHRVQYKFDVTYTPSLRGAARISRKNSFNRLKGLLSDSVPFRRLYVCRNGYSRNMSNESEIWNILRNFNFQKITPSSKDETLKIFNEASIVVGAHGAGLANIFACQPKTDIIELMPSTHSYPYYISLAHACGLNHQIIMSDSNDSFHINEQTLTDCLFKSLNKQ
jgi:hypothetical protein